MSARTPFVVVILGALIAGRAGAQSGGGYSLGWNTLDGGGQTYATGGSYRLGGTTGQPDAGRIAAGAYALHGGFWAPGGQSTVAVPSDESVPSAFAALTPRPNPFRSATTIAFDLPVVGTVRLVVHGIDGRVVRRLAEGQYDPGRHVAIWDGRDDRGRRVAAGIYFARFQAGQFTSIRRVVRLD